MARSGTSLAASIFGKKGYYVAHSEKNDLQKADRFNPSGYWEASSLMAENKKILRSVGFAHDNTWFFDPISEEQVLAIRKLAPLPGHLDFVDEYNRNSPWLWKDPRLCYTLAYWWPLLDPDTTRVLLVTRNSAEIIHSFKRIKHDWSTTIPMEDEHILDRINMHINSAKDILHQYAIPHIEVDYSAYSQKPDEIAERLSQLSGIHLKKHDLGYSEAANHSSVPGLINYSISKLLYTMKKSTKALLVKLNII